MSKISDNFDNDISQIDFNSENQDGDNELISDQLLQSTSNGTLTHKGKKYATGLFWLARNTLSDTSSDRKKAKELKADFTCNRTFADQCGYGYLKKGHRLGMTSIAALAADTLVGEWHGVFEADNGWLYVAVHADNISPDGDLFFQSEQEAYNHFILQSKSFKWPKTYVPDSWDIKFSDGEISIDKLVENNPTTSLAPANLDAIFYGKINKILFFSLCFVSIIIFIFYQAIQWSVSEQPQPTATISENEIGLLEIPPKEIVNNVIDVTQTITINKILNPTIVIEKCLDNIEKLMISIPGWSKTSAICTEQLTTLRWKKGVGDFSILHQYTKDLPPHYMTALSNTSDFSISMVSTYDPLALIEVDLKPKEKTIIDLTNTFNRLGSVSLSEIQIRDSFSETETGPIDSNNLSLSTFPQYRFNLSTQLPANKLKEKFNFPAIKFNKIEWNIQNGQWLYDTIVYSNRETAQN